MLKRILSTLRGYATITASSMNYDSSGEELVVLTNSTVRQGDRVKVELPEGQQVFGRATWRRVFTGSNGEKNYGAIGISLAQDHELDGQALESHQLRRNQRFSHRQWVSFPKLRGLGSVTLDLSIEGCRIAVDLADYVGETHSLCLELPGTSRSISAQAKIIWSRRGESGLRFLNMHVGDEAALAKSLGLETYPAETSWCSLWKRSQTTLSFRVTPVEKNCVSLDFETPNWLATFEIDHWQAKGPWTGTFAHVATSKEHSELADLRQKLGVHLERRKDLIHLSLLDSDNEVVLTIWGVERSFKRTQRGASYQDPTGTDSEVAQSYSPPNASTEFFDLSRFGRGLD